jgi:hypothetical protein
MAVYVTVFLDGAGDELDRLARGPGAETIAEMETALLEGYTLTEGRVHVITGRLLASGHPDSSFSGDAWEGVINFAHYPGIFELARANAATRNHPEGGHYFFDPGGPIFEKKVRQAMWDWVTDYKGGDAPIGDLGPWSGGF